MQEFALTISFKFSFNDLDIYLVWLPSFQNRNMDTEHMRVLTPTELIEVGKLTLYTLMGTSIIVHIKGSQV